AGHAARLARFISTRLVRNDGLFKAVARGRQIEGAELEDYAYIVAGLLDYAEAAKDNMAKQLASRLAHQAWNRFFSSRGWRREANPLLKTIRPEAILPDGATPSPSAMLIAASLRLDDAGLNTMARQALSWQSMAMSHDPFAFATHIRVYQQGIN
ncbi:MAG: thioredoxin domain-containing protein, partial [Hydrogenophilaceae bacterium]|nr:thioredoxin domain-containing protein [Hydrogenophilaceae bacterium]